MMTGLHPIVLIAVIGIVVAFGLLIGAFCAKRKMFKLASLAGAVVCVAPAAFVFCVLNPWVVDGRYRTYRAFYSEIQVGMTKQELNNLIDKHYPSAGPRKRPTVMRDTPDAIGFFMNPEHSREPNCEGVFLTLSEGRVTAKRYSAD
jgi:phosphoglycerol transferase MdoB-like AlkP superfamily enzyme